MEIFRFANIEYLYALFLIPVFTVLFIFLRYERRRDLQYFASKTMWADLMPDVSGSRPVLKFIIWMWILAFAIIACARPQFGSKLETDKKEGVEIIIALDVSNSMLAEDIQPNRLERAKRAISRLVDNLNNDKIGLVVFAGDAYTQLPITTDYQSAKLFLNAVNTGYVPKQGTAIGAAINLGINSFSPQFEGSKAIIIITDGENHEDDAIGSAKAAQEQGIYVHTIGMGLPQGAPIPVTIDGQKTYRKDKDGQVVITKLDERMLQQIAAAGNGIYVRANNSQIGLNTLFDEINKLDKAELESQVYTEYNEQYQWFIALCLLLIILDFLILERKNKYLKNVKLFE